MFYWLLLTADLKSKLKEARLYLKQVDLVCVKILLSENHQTV